MHNMHDAPATLDPLVRPATLFDLRRPARNADFAWDEFSSSDYLAHNYNDLRADDNEILDLVVQWFARCLDDRMPAELAGLDVGTGPNLYPALAMLPYCAKLTLREYSATNVAWLLEATAALTLQWLPFWQAISPADRTGGPGRFDAAATALADRAMVEQGSVFNLPPAAWDLGTMFFVAESISQDPAEFTAAVTAFVRAVKPGGPFAAAFMERSQGYEVADKWFPATPVGRAEVRHCLEQVAAELTVHRVEMRPAPLRPGYTGMIVATGRAR